MKFTLESVQWKNKDKLIGFIKILLLIFSTLPDGTPKSLTGFKWSVIGHERLWQSDQKEPNETKILDHLSFYIGYKHLCSSITKMDKAKTESDLRTYGDKISSKRRVYKISLQKLEVIFVG